MITTGLLDIFSKKRQNTTPRSGGYYYAPTMDGNTPFYSAFGDSVYASDIVVQSIRCKANEFKKLDPRHIKNTAAGQTLVTDSSIAKVLRRPNPYMTTADFLEKITILRELNKNAFIYLDSYMTVGGEKKYTAMYPLKPTHVEYWSNSKGDLFLHFEFANGYTATLPSEDVVHWRKDYGVNDYFGGGVSGSNDNKGLLTMLQRYDQLTQSIAKALECSCQINGIVKYNSYLDDADMEADRKDFLDRVKNNKSGILVTDLKTEYTSIPRDIKLVDADTLKFFYDTILRANGTSLAILNGDYTKAQKEAYYEHALEADIKSLGQAISRCVFSEREESGYGNEIVLYPNAIQFMSMENKIAFAQVAVPSGHLLKDEVRALFGYPPLPDGQGQVIAQGYNNLLDENNNNKLQNDDSASAGAVDDDTHDEILEDVEDVVKQPLLVGQIQALTQIVADYQAGKYTYNQAVNMLMIGVGLSKDEAEKILDKQDDSTGGANNE